MVGNFVDLSPGGSGGGGGAPSGPAGGDLGGTYPNPTVTGLHISATQGDILYYNGSSWVVLNASTDGYVLTTHTNSSNPTWTGATPLTSSLPADVTKSGASVGVSGFAARSDHKHNITTAAATSVGATNAEGTATTLARSDHTHAVNNLSIASQAQGDVLYFDGANWARLAAASVDGYVLTSHGASANPTWTFGGFTMKRGHTIPNNSTQIAVTDGNQFIVPVATLSGNIAVTLATTNAVTGSLIEIVRLDSTAFTITIVNGGAAGTNLYTFPVSVQRATDFRFDGTNWQLGTTVAITPE